MFYFQFYVSWFFFVLAAASVLHFYWNKNTCEVHGFEFDRGQKKYMSINSYRLNWFLLMHAVQCMQRPVYSVALKMCLKKMHIIFNVNHTVFMSMFEGSMNSLKISLITYTVFAFEFAFAFSQCQKKKKTNNYTNPLTVHF